MKYYKYNFNNRYYYLKINCRDKVSILRHNEPDIDVYFKVINSFKENIDKAELISLSIFRFELRKNKMVRELSK